MKTKYEIRNTKYETQRSLPRVAQRSRGVTLFIAVTIMSVLLFVSFVVVNIAIKATVFASSNRDSQYAFYAADAGLECAVYWDSKTPSKFDESADGSPINCGGVSISTDDVIVGTTTLAKIGGNISSLPIARVNTAVGLGSAESGMVSSENFNAIGGNFVVVSIRYLRDSGEDITNVTDYVGNNYKFAVGKTLSDNSRIEMWYAENISGINPNRVTATFSPAATHRAIIVAQYTGIKSINALDVTATGESTSGTVTSGTFSTSQGNELIIASAQQSSFLDNWSAGASYDLVRVAYDGVIMMEEKIAPVTLTNTTASAVSSNPTSKKAIIVATFKGTSGSVGYSGIFGFDLDHHGSNKVPYCAVVTVVRGGGNTYVESRGYNTCDANAKRRVERGIKLLYPNS